MRVFLLSAALAAGLAACGKSDFQIETEFRSQLGTQCSREMLLQAPPGLNVPRFCSCFVDAAMENRTAEELQRILDDPEAARRAGEEIGPRCMYMAS